MSQVRKTKPARVQANPDDFEDESLPPQTGTVFNIWYNKWSGGASGSSYQLIKSKYKLDVERDSGYTKADKAQGQQFFCLYFAKGMCVKGKKCEYLHRVPSELDLFPITVDCFGRERFSDYKDDMSGVGSFSTVNTTLYIGGLTKVSSKTQELLNARFRVFGKIKKINVINSKNCAFVSFKNEQNAQFAKEAMSGQSLYDDDTVLNVKWANEDPNPEAIKQRKREFEQETEDAVRKLLNNFETKRAKIDENNEPVVEEPEDTVNEKVKEDKIKTIEYSREEGEEGKPTDTFKSSTLNYLRFLKTKDTPIVKPTLVNAYESDDDNDDDE